MPIHLEWGNPEKTILFENLDGEWTLSDVYAMLDDCEKMVSSVMHRVDIIADLSNSHFSSGNLLTALSRAQRTQPPNVGLIIAVKANRYLKAMADVAATMWPRSTEKLRYVNSIEAAYALLEEDSVKH